MQITTALNIYRPHLSPFVKSYCLFFLPPLMQRLSPSAAGVASHAPLVTLREQTRTVCVYVRERVRVPSLIASLNVCLPSSSADGGQQPFVFDGLRKIIG